MSERRFDFYERDSSGKSIYACTITEAELLHRLYLIRTLIETGQSLCQLNERGIDILLHGEKEQPWPGPEDILEMRGKEKPDEWEEWAKQVSAVIWGDDGIQESRFVEALISIPCNPRKKP